MIFISDYLQNRGEGLGLSVLQTNGINSPYVIDYIFVQIFILSFTKIRNLKYDL